MVGKIYAYGQVQIRIQIVGARIYQTIFSEVLELPDLDKCIFKTMGSKENMLEISWQSSVPSRSYRQ